jgi:phage portal protein BeeE
MKRKTEIVKVEQLPLSHNDLEFLAGREFAREEINRVFGIRDIYWVTNANKIVTAAARALSRLHRAKGGGDNNGCESRD